MILAVTAGLAGGRAMGGRVARLAYVRIRGWPLLGAALAAQVALAVVAADLRRVGAVLVVLAAIAWALVNAVASPVLRAGMLLLIAGMVLNVAVIAGNGGMPVSHQALDAAGLAYIDDVEAGFLFKHVDLQGSSRLTALADVVPVRPFRTVVSLGDIIMLVGLAASAARATMAGATSEAVRDVLPASP